jgi:hypothetical protein
MVPSWKTQPWQSILNGRSTLILYSWLPLGISQLRFLPDCITLAPALQL